MCLFTQIIVTKISCKKILVQKFVYYTKWRISTNWYGHKKYFSRKRYGFNVGLFRNN